MITLSINPENIKMTTCFDVTNFEMPIAVFCEYNGKKEKYWMERGDNGFLKLVCVEVKKD
jgi:hypothetical protein